MSSSVVEQIAGLERERTRLEGRLAADENWRALVSLQALNGSAPPDAGETEQRLRRALAANPYYSARIKIVEAITILRRLNDVAPLQVSTIAVSGLEHCPENTERRSLHGAAWHATRRPTPRRRAKSKSRRAELSRCCSARRAGGTCGPVSDFIRIRGIAPETAGRPRGIGHDALRRYRRLDRGRRAPRDGGTRTRPQDQQGKLDRAGGLACEERRRAMPVASPVEPPSPRFRSARRDCGSGVRKLRHRCQLPTSRQRSRRLRHRPSCSPLSTLEPDAAAYGECGAANTGSVRIQSPATFAGHNVTQGMAGPAPGRMVAATLLCSCSRCR